MTGTRRPRLALLAAPETSPSVLYGLGYEDPTFFRRLFKRTTGLTPAAYRRKFAPIVAVR